MCRRAATAVRRYRYLFWTRLFLNQAIYSVKTQTTTSVLLFIGTALPVCIDTGQHSPTVKFQCKSLPFASSHSVPTSAHTHILDRVVLLRRSLVPFSCPVCERVCVRVGRLCTVLLRLQLQPRLAVFSSESRVSLSSGCMAAAPPLQSWRNSTERTEQASRAQHTVKSTHSHTHSQRALGRHWAVYGECSTVSTPLPPPPQHCRK